MTKKKQGDEQEEPKQQKAKHKRRGHGEGTIFQRQDGRWEASLTIESTGKRKSVYGKTRKEAADKLDKARQEQKQGILATGPQQTLKAFLEQWLEEVQKPLVRIGTYNNYRIALNKHIIPSLGNIPLQKLTPQKLQSFYAQKIREGLTPGGVANIHKSLRRALVTAVRWNLLSRNVCDLVSPPARLHHEVVSLTQEQVQHLLQSASDNELEALITVAVTTGMRKGELLGLRWSDIDIDTKSLQVRRTIKRVGKYGIVESEPKTPKSRRNIILPEFVLVVLKQHRIRQLERKLQLGDKWEPTDFVFTNGHGGYLETSQLHGMFKKLLKEAALPDIRFHDLRHSAATILLSMGVHPKIVQELLGHSTIGMTMDVYSHVLPTMQREAMNRLDTLFGEKK